MCDNTLYRNGKLEIPKILIPHSSLILIFLKYFKSLGMDRVQRDKFKKAFFAAWGVVTSREIHWYKLIEKFDKNEFESFFVTILNFQWVGNDILLDNANFSEETIYEYFDNKAKEFNILVKIDGYFCVDDLLKFCENVHGRYMK